MRFSPQALLCSYLAQEKRRLQRSLARIERKERNYRSLLIPLDDAPENVFGDDSPDEDSDSDRRVLFPQRVPLTPAGSDHEIGTKSRTKSPRLPDTAPEAGPSTHRNSGSISTDRMLRIPSYTFAEGTDSAASSEDRANGTSEEGLAPNPIRDPSSYLVWFDLEVRLCFVAH